MSKKPSVKPPPKLAASNYDWEPIDGDDDFGPPPRKWTTWSRAYWDDGCQMIYELRRTKDGRYMVWFEGSKVGAAKGYSTKTRAAAAIARSENASRLAVWRERVAAWNKKRRRA
jgi:hypothetical protein